MAHIPRRVFRHNVNILCARCKVIKGNGLLGGVAGSTRHGGVYGRGGIAAFHDCIVIGASLVAGKLHRSGGCAVAGSRAIGKRRGGGVNGGTTDFFKLAGVVGLFIAVVLLVEYIQLRRAA